MRISGHRNIAWSMVLLLATASCVYPHGVKKGEQARWREPVVIYSVMGEYDEVWEDLEMTLNERGLVISSVSHVGEMIDRTGKALGRTRKVFAKANVMEFCSAIVSRNMLEQNPHLIAFCPYQIMVYTLPGDEKKVYLSYRRPLWPEEADRRVLDAVEDLLTGIIEDLVKLHSEYGQ